MLPAPERSDLEERMSTPFSLGDLWGGQGIALLIALAIAGTGVYALVDGDLLVGGIVAVVGLWLIQNEFCGLTSEFTCTQCRMRQRRYESGKSRGYSGIVYDTLYRDGGPEFDLPSATPRRGGDDEN